MKAAKEAQIVKFKSPLPDENPNQIYVILEVIEDGEKSRAEIQALNTGLPFPPIAKVRLMELEIVESETHELIGHKVTILKSDSSQVEGRVIKVADPKIELKMSTEHLGALLINESN